MCGKKGGRASGTGITGHCQQLLASWEPNPGYLQEQQVLSTMEPTSAAPQTIKLKP